MENLENIIRDKTGVEKEIELGGCSWIRSRKQTNPILVVLFVDLTF